MGALGRKLLIKKSGEVLAGLRSVSIAWSGGAIDITDGELSGARALLDESDVEQFDLQVEGIIKKAVFRRLILGAGKSRMLNDITIEWPPENGSPPETLSGNFRLSNYEEGAPYNDAITFSATLQSSSTGTFVGEIKEPWGCGPGGGDPGGGGNGGGDDVDGPEEAYGTDWLDVVFANGKFVAVGDPYVAGENDVMTSPNGEDWTSVSSGIPGVWRKIKYISGRYWALSGGNDLMSSADGVMWAAEEGVPYSTNDFSGNDGNQFFSECRLAVGRDAVGYTMYFAAVPEEPTQYVRELTSSGGVWDFEAVEWLGGKYIAVGGFHGLGGGAIIRYADVIGGSWSNGLKSGGASLGGDTLRGIASGNSIYLAAGGGFSCVSPDAGFFSWVTHETGVNTSKIIFNAGEFLSISDGVNLAKTVDGEGWSLSEISAEHSHIWWNSLDSGAGKIVFVGPENTVRWISR
jgi:predicted secreted protein